MVEQKDVMLLWFYLTIDTCKMYWQCLTTFSEKNLRLFLRYFVFRSSCAWYCTLFALLASRSLNKYKWMKNEGICNYMSANIFANYFKHHSQPNSLDLIHVSVNVSCDFACKSLHEVCQAKLDTLCFWQILSFAGG